MFELSNIWHKPLADLIKIHQKSYNIRTTTRLQALPVAPSWGKASLGGPLRSPALLKSPSSFLVRWRRRSVWGAQRPHAGSQGVRSCAVEMKGLWLGTDVARAKEEKTWENPKTAYIRPLFYWNQEGTKWKVTWLYLLRYVFYGVAKWFSDSGVRDFVSLSLDLLQNLLGLVFLWLLTLTGFLDGLGFLAVSCTTLTSFYIFFGALGSLSRLWMLRFGYTLHDSWEMPLTPKT